MFLRSARMLAALILLAGSAGAAVLLLTADGWAVNRLNVRIWNTMTSELGIRHLVTPEQFAVLANVALFIPVFAALAVLVPTWWWVLLAAVLSTAVEVYQSSLGGLRIASFGDVLANTLGALLGVLLGRWVHHRLRTRDLSRASPAAAAPAATAPTTPGAAPQGSAGGPGGSPDDRG